MSLFSQSLHIDDVSNEYTHFMNAIVLIFSYFIARLQKYCNPLAMDDLTETIGEYKSTCIGQTASLPRTACS
jgi:hypothetical protein